MDPDTHEDAGQRLLRLLAPIHERARLVARRLSRCCADGDDLFQETALRALRRLDTLRDEARFRSWFFAILFSLHRRRQRSDFWRRLWPLELVPEPSVEPSFADEGADRLARALASLSAKEREALVLADLSELRLDEIAELQGSSLAAVKSRVARARARVRQRYLASERPLVQLAAHKETP